MSPEDERLLIAWMRRRDEAAFTKLCGKYGAMIHATCQRVLGNAALAEETSQDCLARFAQLRTAPRGPLGPWLHRMATHRAIDRLRSEQRRRQREQAYAEAQPSAAESTWDDVSPHIDAVVAALPGKQRAVVIEHYYRGRTHEDIAGELGLTRAAVTRRIHRALARLGPPLRKKGITISAAALGGMLHQGWAQGAPPPPAWEAHIAQAAAAAPAASGALAGSAILWKALLAGCVAVSGGVVLRAMVAEEGEAPINAAAEALPAEAAPSAPRLGAPREPATRVLGNGEGPAPSAALAADAGSFPVEGRVFDAVTGAPLPGVTVRAREWKGHEEAAAVTNAEGRYRLMRAMDTDYMVYIRQPDVPAPYVYDSGKHRHRAAGGKAAAGLDFPFEPGVGIAGRVLDHRGRPVTEGDVAALQEGLTIGQAAVSGDGAFQMYIRPPAVRVELTARTFDPRAESFQHGPYDLPAEGIAGLELTVYPPSTISGTLVDAGGVPIPRAHLSALLDASPAEEQASPDRKRFDGEETDEAGAFEIQVSYPGRYRMQVATPTLRRALPQTVDVPPGKDVAGVRVVAPPEYELYLAQPPGPDDGEGGEAAYPIAGQVLDAQGRPVAGARLRATPEADRRFSELAESDGKGRFAFTVPAPGRYQLHAAHPSHTSVIKEGVPAGSRNTVLRMQGRGAIRFTALDAATGEAIAGAAAVLWPARKRAVTGAAGFDWAQWQRVYSAIGGRGEPSPLEQVELGDYWIWVGAPGYVPARKALRVSAGAEEPVACTLPLRRGATIEGKVLGPNGEALGHARVALADPEDQLGLRMRVGGLPAANSDSEGNYRIEGAPPVTLFLGASYPGLGGTLQAVHVDRPVVRADLRLTGTGSVGGRLTAGGQPLIDAMVTVYFTHDHQMNQSYAHTANDLGGLLLKEDHMSTQTDTDGNYLLEGVPVGRCRVRAHSRTATGEPRNLERAAQVVHGKVTGVDLNFPVNSASLSGTVVVDGKAPLGMRIDLYIETPTGVVDVDGQFEGGAYRFDELPAGPVVMEVEVISESGQETVRSSHQLALIPREHVVHDLQI